MEITLKQCLFLLQSGIVADYEICVDFFKYQEKTKMFKNKQNKKKLPELDWWSISVGKYQITAGLERK